MPQRDIASVRREFPGTAEWAYLDVAARGLLPIRARAAINAHLDRRMLDGGDKAAMFADIEAARSLFAAMIGAGRDEVAITKNISEGLNIIAAAYPWAEGDNVVVCPEREHPNNIYLWLGLARRHGIEVRTVPSRDGLIDAEEMIAAIDERTRIVSVSSVSFSPGLRTDLDAIGTACRERGVLLLVDAAQSMGILKLDVSKTPVDAIAVSTQKGLLGLYGMGFLYCRREWAERLEPAYLARFGVDLGDAHEADVGQPDYRLMPGALRFDLGNYNFPAAAGLVRSMELLAEVGAEPIEDHVGRLARKLAEELSELGLSVAGMPDGRHLASIVTAAAPAGDPERVQKMLDDDRVRVSVRRGSLRFSFHLYNSEEDVDRAVSAVRRTLSAAQ